MKAESSDPAVGQISLVQDRTASATTQVKAESFDPAVGQISPAQCRTAPAAAIRLTAMSRSVLTRLQENTRATAVALLGDMLRGALAMRQDEKMARHRKSSATKRGRSPISSACPFCKA